MAAAIVVANYNARIQKTRYQRKGGALSVIVPKRIRGLHAAKNNNLPAIPIKLRMPKILMKRQTGSGSSICKFHAYRTQLTLHFAGYPSIRYLLIARYKCLINGGYLGSLQKKLPQRIGGTVADTVVPEGNAVVSGVVREGKSPVIRKVRLYRKDNGALVSEKKSSANGDYSFEKLPLGMAFFVVSHDSNGVYNAAISDNITA